MEGVPGQTRGVECDGLQGLCQPKPVWDSMAVAESCLLGGVQSKTLKCNKISLATEMQTILKYSKDSEPFRIYLTHFIRGIINADIL